MVNTTCVFEVLKKGSKGDDVKRLQERLKSFGFYGGSIDGDFGSQTEKAVIEFQKNNAATFDAMVANGVVGYETEAMIERNLWLNKRPDLKRGAVGEDVKKLQSLLIKMSQMGFKKFGKPFSIDLGNIDGDFGPKTEAAVMEYQKYHQINVDGVVTSPVWKLLSYVHTNDLTDEHIVLNNVFDVA